MPRSRLIINVYSESESNAIITALSKNNLSKRDKAICLLVLETGLRGIDVCNLKLNDIDWKNDTISIIQHKTNQKLVLPLRNTYGNAIADYLLNERPKCDCEFLFIRSAAPYSKLTGEGSSVRVILQKLELIANIDNTKRGSGSRITRHNAASVMLKAGVKMSDISSVLGHTDASIVNTYLSTDAKMMSTLTLPIPKGGHV